VALLSYGNPIRFDFGAVRHLPDGLARLGVKRPLVVTDRGVRGAGLVDRVVDGLTAAGIGVTIYDGTPGNPTEDAVAEAVALYQADGCDGVVCVGGGSPIDLGKAVALLAVNGGPLAQYDPLQGGNKRVKGFAPLVAIPTTAGTGSEASFGFLISMNDVR
jgi:4-hydroxybutyrate dehydrogenase